MIKIVIVHLAPFMSVSRNTYNPVYFSACMLIFMYLVCPWVIVSINITILIYVHITEGVKREWKEKAISSNTSTFVSDLRHVGGFLRVLRFPPPNKLTPTIYS